MPTLPAIAAVLLAGARWLLQGSGNVYTNLSRGAYIPDPLVQWRYQEEGPIWIGLEAIGALVAVALTVAAAAWFIAKDDDRRRFVKPLWVLSSAALALPLAAFASGGLPEGARLTKPQREQASPTSGIEAHLQGLPAGRYDVDTGSALGSVVATVSAGGESFETRFSGWQGTLRGDPSDLSSPLNIQVEIDPATADTGVELRSKHATEYLQAETYPRIRLDIERFDATERSATGTVRFAATGSLAFMGETLSVAVKGELQSLDAQQRSEQDIVASAAMLASASFSIPIAQTPLRSDAGDFSAEQIPISMTLLLTPTNEP